MHDPNHPIWKLLDSIVKALFILGVLYLILFMTAEHFDGTEITTLVSMVVPVLVALLAPSIVKKSN